MIPELKLLLPELDEKSRRLALGMAARAAGKGGTGAVARLTGASWQTVASGAAELASGDTAPPGRARRPGGGRKKLSESDPGLLPALLDLVEDSTRGDPESPLLWTSKSTHHLADALNRQGHRCSQQTVWRMLREQGYSLQAPAKVLDGSAHPDRDRQFRYIAGRVKRQLAAGEPVISVDAKKREEIGNYAQHGRDWHPAGEAPEVLDHTFPDRKGPGHAIPYGIYDPAADSGFVNVGTDANTGAFAVASIRQWHEVIGKHAYPDARSLLVTCDSGSSNGLRNRSWKKELAKFAEEAGLEITVCHFPPGTSKWNKVEHRLFSQVSHAWRGRPLTSYDTVISTIGAVTTKTGLTATAVLDTRPYPGGEKIGDAEIRDIEERCLTRHEFHGDWNYTVIPVPRPARPPQPPPPPPPRVPLDVLNQAPLTGIDPAALPGLALAVGAAAADSRRARLDQRRGGPRTGKGKGRTPLLNDADLTAAALIRQHAGISGRELGPLLGVQGVTLNQALVHVDRALAVLPRPPAVRPPPPLRTRASLTSYAARHGIDLSIPQPDIPQAAPEATLTTPDTPKNHLILDRLHNPHDDTHAKGHIRL